MLSSRASLNGRVPIIAVSASLLEREHQTYVNAGFDGWILKPVSFARLSEIMSGIVDEKARKANLYEKGEWERGGWFQEAQKDVFEADTRPGGKVPFSGASEGVRRAAASDDPMVKEDNSSRQTHEQARLVASQEKQDEESGETHQVEAT